MHLARRLSVSIRNKRVVPNQFGWLQAPRNLNFFWIKNFGSPCNHPICIRKRRASARSARLRGQRSLTGLRRADQKSEKGIFGRGHQKTGTAGLTPHAMIDAARLCVDEIAWI